MLRDEFISAVNAIGIEKLNEKVFDSFYVQEKDKQNLLTSLLSGHNILILGPPGSGKTDVAKRIAGILGNIEVVKDCPLNCHINDASCPWCLEKKASGIELTISTICRDKRIKKIQGAGGLVVEDILGDVDPEMALKEGICSPRAFIPGKLLRANKGVLLIDFIDRVPERVLNAILCALQGDTITIGSIDQEINLDTLVIATGSEKVLKSLPLDISDCFDIICLDYLNDSDCQKEIIKNNTSHLYGSENITESAAKKIVDIVNETREHFGVKRGISTRGMIKYAELLASFPELKIDDENKMLKIGSHVSLPHRLGLSMEADVPGKRLQIIDEIVDGIIGENGEKEELVSLSKDDILSLVEEMVSEDAFRIPLKYGAFDLLLKRIQDYPDSRFYQLYQETLKNLEELYPDRLGKDNLTAELLKKYETDRIRDERLKRLLEEEALVELISILHNKSILEQESMGWGLSQQGITFLLEKLAPRIEEDNYFYGQGQHSTGKKSILGEGKIVGRRKFRYGDRYRDVSVKHTIREAIRNRSEIITREDIMVLTKDIRTKMNIVILLDLSGTMRQLKKLWYAKQSAIALTLAISRYHDNVALIAFSNLADVVVGLSSNPHHVAKKVLDLELHENAFTNIGYGISKANTFFARHPKGEAKQHIILISDGDATAPHPSPEKHALRQAAAAKRRGITISSVCISQHSANPDLMEKISKIGKGRIYFIAAEDLPSTLVEEAAASYNVL